MKKSELKQLIKEETQKILNESQYSQLELTSMGELLLNYLNSDVESDKPENYHLSSRDEQILMDMGMYIDGLYGENRFINLDLFALDIASGEYQDPQFGKNEVVKKINRAIQKGWIKIVPYKGNPLNEEFKRIQKLAGIQLNENSFKKEEYKYLKITPEKFKIGDLFLMSPEDEGEFFGYKEATKISSIILPKDGRGNTASIKTEEGEKKLSVSSLYNIARKKS